MRNLKKVLSLVLVVAMLASMMIVGAAAADTEKTNYPEAAAVITGIGVMEGDDAGMRYGDTVTREEAAAIICRILLGNTAETLKTTTAPFEDVAANRWSAGYIAYLKAQGIVSGVSDTEFDPTAKVTGIAFAKMLLTAVGYGKVGEFEGAAWDINTITLANEKGIYATTKAADLAAAATREECMLYAFNTITKVPTVKYNKTFESYYSGDSAMSPAVGPAALAYTLGVTKFNLGISTTNVEDAMNRPVVTYTLAGKDLASVPVTPNFTVENVATGATLYAKLGAALADITTIKHYVDGAANASPITKAQITATSITPVAGQGAVTEAYLSADGKTLTLVTCYEYIGKVTAIDAKTGVVTLDNDSTLTGIIAGVAVNDYVIYTQNADANAPAHKVVTAEKAAPVTGVFQSSKTVYGTTQYVIGGTTYLASSKIVGSAPTAFDAAYNVYTDSLGNILMAVSAIVPVTSNDYLYVVAGRFDGGDGFTPAVAQLNVVYANGGQAVVNYTVVNGKVMLPGAGTATDIDSASVTPGWYSYVKAEDGSVTLVKAADYKTTNGLTLTKGAYSVNVGNAVTKNATAKTVLNIVNKKGEVLTYTGYAQFPEKTKAYDTMYTLDLDGRLVAINAYANEDVLTPEGSKVVGYCAEYLYLDGKGYHYNFYVDGKKVEVVNAAASGVLSVGTAYNMTNTNGVYTAGDSYVAAVAKDPVTGLYPNAHTIKFVDEQYFELKNGSTLSFTALTKVYDVANGGAATTFANAANRGVIYKAVDGVVVNAWLLP